MTVNLATNPETLEPTVNPTKKLVKRLAAGWAAAAVCGAAAAGLWSSAPAVPTAFTVAVQPVVFGVPLPQTPAPDLSGPLTQTLNGLAADGSFAGPKGAYVQGGVGRIEAITADRAFNNAAAKGYFPLGFNIADIDQDGDVATANVTATANNGAAVTQPVTFTAGPSPTGWQISKGSALSLLSSVG